MREPTHGVRVNGAPNATSARSRRAHAVRWSLPAGALVGIAMVAAACGSSGASSPVSTSHTAAKASPASVTVSSAHVGSLGTVLVNGAGLTLYRYTADSSDHATCTGACASLWPPLTVPAGEHVVAGRGVKASLLATVTRTDGSQQVVFNGMPLYLYKGDTRAGQTKGQGIERTWFAVSAVAASAPATTTTSAPPSSTTPTRAPASPAPAGAGAGGGTAVGGSPAASPPATSPPVPSPPVTSPPVTPPPATAPPPPMTTAPTTTPTTAAGGGYGY